MGDEYLQLSYHGLPAKEKDFNADIKTDFDKSIRKVNIVPQEKEQHSSFIFQYKQAIKFMYIYPYQTAKITSLLSLNK